MPDTTSAATAAPMPDDHDRTIAVRAVKFDAALSEWLAARAAVAAPGGDSSDEARDVIHARQRAAEVSFLTTPAHAAWAIIAKIEAIETVLAEDIRSGQPAYPVTIVGLAAVKADILALGIAD